MPVLEVEIVIQGGEILPNDLAGRIANRAGEIFSSAPGHTWVKLRTIPMEYYAENNISAGSILPVFVTILKAHLPDYQALQAEVAALSRAIADCCGRPTENVHILYLPPGAGRVAFGGRLIPVK